MGGLWCGVKVEVYFICYTWSDSGRLIANAILFYNLHLLSLHPQQVILYVDDTFL